MPDSTIQLGTPEDVLAIDVGDMMETPLTLGNAVVTVEGDVRLTSRGYPSIIIKNEAAIEIGSGAALTTNGAYMSAVQIDADTLTLTGDGEFTVNSQSAAITGSYNTTFDASQFAGSMALYCESTDGTAIFMFEGTAKLAGSSVVIAKNDTKAPLECSLFSGTTLEIISMNDLDLSHNGTQEPFLMGNSNITLQSKEGDVTLTGKNTEYTSFMKCKTLNIQAKENVLIQYTDETDVGAAPFIDAASIVITAEGSIEVNGKNFTKQLLASKNLVLNAPIVKIHRAQQLGYVHSMLGRGEVWVPDNTKLFLWGTGSKGNDCVWTNPNVTPIYATYGGKVTGALDLASKKEDTYYSTNDGNGSILCEPIILENVCYEMTLTLTKATLSDALTLPTCDGPVTINVKNNNVLKQVICDGEVTVQGINGSTLVCDSIAPSVNSTKNLNLTLKNSNVTTSSVNAVGYSGIMLENSTLTVGDASNSNASDRLNTTKVTMDESSVINLNVPLYCHTEDGLSGIVSYLPAGHQIGTVEVDNNEIYTILDTEGEAATGIVIKKPAPVNPPSDDDGSSKGGSSGKGSSTGGSSVGDNTIVTIPPVNTEAPNPLVQGSVTVTPTISGGRATVTVPETTVRNAITKAQAEGKKNGTTANGISVEIKANTDNATDLAVNVPKATVDALVNAGVKETKITSGVATISLSLDTLKAIQKQAGTDVTITATKVENTTLTPEVKALVGNRPVYDLSITGKNGTKVTNFGNGTVSVSIPYTLGKDETPGNVVAYYIDSTGTVTLMPNSVYDPITQTLNFVTNHFSMYGVGYKASSIHYKDITNHWAKDSIDFVMARGLLSGTSKNQFSPDAPITYELLVTALSKLGNTKVGEGIANGIFAPNQLISREQMAIIMQNYAKEIGLELPRVHAKNTFADNDTINDYAKNAVRTMQMAGVLTGKNANLFDPHGTVTRAQISVVLKRFVELTVRSGSAQGWRYNDSGKQMFYENGRPVTGTKNIGGVIYTFDANGEIISSTIDLGNVLMIPQK